MSSNTKCPENFILIKEGLADICIPNPELYKRSNGVYEPAWAPVFYNPVMKENRDIAILFISSFFGNEKIVAVDPLAATGVRGIRFAKELTIVEKVILNDINPKAVELCHINTEINGLRDKIIVYSLDANELLFKLYREHIKPSYIDIDPFGSPAPFTFSALYAVFNRGVVAFTATDLAPLEGKYPHKLFRRYGVKGIKIDISKEIALRALLAFIARIAGVVDKYIVPVVTYYSKHYVRTYVQVFEGGLKSSSMLSNCLKYLLYCTSCTYREIVDETISTYRCPVCNSKVVFIGPIWVCPLGQPWIIEKMLDELKRREYMEEISYIEKLLQTLREELSMNSFPVRISSIARFLKSSMPKVIQVIECLNQKGYRASRTHHIHDGIKTDAEFIDILECVKNSRQRH